MSANWPPSFSDMSDNEIQPTETSVRCYLCHGSKDLVMLAHRVDGYLVGWLFVCKADFDDIKGKTLKIEMLEEEAK